MTSRADVNSDNRLIFGNLFDGNAMPIREIKGETGPIIIEGEVFSYEKKDIKNVFTPGFTTKKRGWGLGLSLAKRIVEEYHRGRIFVKESEVGVGTTFRIELEKEEKTAQKS